MSNQNRNIRVRPLNDIWLFRPIRLYDGKRRRRRRKRNHFQRRLNLPEIVQSPNASSRPGAKHLFGAFLALPVFSMAVWLLAAVGAQARKVATLFAEHGLWIVLVGLVVIAAGIIGVAFFRRSRW